jgi:hypothetical protein
MRKMVTLAVLLLINVGFTSSSLLEAQVDESFYNQKCGRCHSAFSPSDYPAEDWPGIVRSMKAQAALSSEDMDEIIDYLVSDKGSKTESTGSGPTLGGYLYTEYFRSPEKTSNFDIHYLAVYVSGWVNENINYLGEFELEHGGTGGDNTFVEQAYIDYWFRPNLALKIGAMLTPFNRFDEFHDPISNPVITRPQVSRDIGVSAWKEVGLDFHGYLNINDLNSISFDLYTINGLGAGSNLRGSRQYRDNNEKLAFGGRANYIYRDLLEIGGSVYRGAWDDNGDYLLTMMGTHFMLSTDYVDLYGEFLSATSENPPEDSLGNTQADGDMSGYFIMVSRLFQKKYRPTLRYGMLDYLDNGAALGRSLTDKDLSELALGFTYYPTSKVAFKVEYTIFTEGNRVADEDNNQVGLQAAVKF